MGEFIEMVYNLSIENRERAVEKQKRKEIRESKLKEIKRKILISAKNGKFMVYVQKLNGYDCEELKKEGFNVRWDENNNWKQYVCWGGYKDK